MYSHPQLVAEHAEDMNPEQLDLDEIVRCPWCGALAWEGDTDRPATYCNHKPIPACLAAQNLPVKAERGESAPALPGGCSGLPADQRKNHKGGSSTPYESGLADCG